MKLFDFLKIIFSSSDKYENLTKYERGKNRFMVMRYLSIKHPDAANLLNVNGTDPAYINDSFRMICKQYEKVPGWVWTKVKKQKKSSSNEFVPSEDTLKFYLEKNKATKRDYEEVLKTSRKNEMLKELEELEKLLEYHEYRK